MCNCRNQNWKACAPPHPAASTPTKDPQRRGLAAADCHSPARAAMQQTCQGPSATSPTSLKDFFITPCPLYLLKWFFCLVIYLSVLFLMFSVDEGLSSLCSQTYWSFPFRCLLLLFKLESPLSTRDKTGIDLAFFLVPRISFHFSFPLCHVALWSAWVSLGLQCAD